ncbi:hypothetical protein VNO77_23255 [Canavalia gladiata]|uniref:Uncharacterized protein n=1 Tax=Canavalia gladiata TaxID=3824 RepID=A0AAN9L7I4_CANGL
MYSSFLPPIGLIPIGAAKSSLEVSCDTPAEVDSVLAGKRICGSQLELRPVHACVSKQSTMRETCSICMTGSHMHLLPRGIGEQKSKSRSLAHSSCLDFSRGYSGRNRRGQIEPEIQQQQ